MEHTQNCAPLALFVYNRPEHTRKTVEALQANLLAPHTPLFVFCDAACDELAREGVERVRDYVARISGFASVTIISRERNLGLANSIIDGVSMLCERFGRAIVLEDDLPTSPHFLTFMNDGLDTYASDERVQSVCGYMYPVGLDTDAPSFFLSMPHSWGWATWSDRWRIFERDGQALLEQIRSRGLRRAFNANGPHSNIKMLKDQIAGRNHSWFIRWHAAGFLRHMLTLYSAHSLVRNIGIDGSGVHCAEWKIDPYWGEVAVESIRVDRTPIIEHAANLARLNKYFVRIRGARYINFFLRKLAQFRRKFAT
ncbi:glycosyltransferase family 2 protein [Thiobacillus sp.]|uniref:glycosyltransferase family 2 protein n=1 Tax=Thiobacillus sp. TaxID=924 RepID=UPI0025F643B7|nr:glycosyltransferase family 2 protein [Thiobacillus sp.]